MIAFHSKLILSIAISLAATTLSCSNDDSEKEKRPIDEVVRDIFSPNRTETKEDQVATIGCYRACDAGINSILQPFVTLIGNGEISCYNESSVPKIAKKSATFVFQINDEQALVHPTISGYVPSADAGTISVGGLITPESEWCSNSCGYVNLEVRPLCPPKGVRMEKFIVEVSAPKIARGAGFVINLATRAETSE